MFYVIPSAVSITECGHGHHPEPKLFESLEAAKAEADKLHTRYENHWNVVKVEWVWGTRTLADLRIEGALTHPKITTREVE